VFDYEDAKARGHTPGDGRGVIFVNTDPSLVLLFLPFLAVAGAAREDLMFRLAIHETADVKASEAFWLTDREMLIAGAIAYWCEGAKSKPYRPEGQVSCVNSDPGLIVLFLRFLEKAGVPRHQLRYSVHIHENGDLTAATHWWAALVEATADQFVRPVIKHHEPRTTHDTSNAEYRGCLQIRVLKGARLYRKIAGWAEGTMRAA
jgi:hypothetical protein